MKKIALVCNTSWGMMMFRSGLMKKLIKDGYHVSVIAPRDDHSKEVEALGCEYIHVSIDNKGSNIVKDMLLVNRLTKIYKKLQPDLIFHYTIKPNIYGTLAAKKANIPAIAVVTGLGFTFINHGLTAKAAKLLYKVSLKHAYKVWFINHEDRKKFIKEKIVSRELMEIIPGEGVDMDFYSPRPKRANDGIFRFILIARLLWDKGVGELVEAAAELKKVYPNVEVDLVGFVDAKNPKAISRKQVEEWVSKGWVKYLGPTNDVREYIAEADCIVLPSYREGISKILLEAASMAKPIVATNVPGCRDVVEHGSSGFLCRVMDPYDLALKMQKMVNLSEDAREKMGFIGREHIRREYDEKIVLEKYLETISQLTQDIKQSTFVLKKD